MKRFALVMISVTLGGCATQPQIGRYQLHSTGGQSVWVIDTATGQVWSHVTHDQFLAPKLPTTRP
jgi:hypothetical protein